MKQLVYNAIKCPDKTILVSRYRHDYVTYVDANGEEYMLDGGTDYIRTNVNTEPAESLAVYADAEFVDIREVLEWGSYGRDGKSPLRWIKLKDMEIDHIRAVIDECHIAPWRKELLEHELKYRRD